MLGGSRKYCKLMASTSKFQHYDRYIYVNLITTSAFPITHVASHVIIMELACSHFLPHYSSSVGIVNHYCLSLDAGVQGSPPPS